MGDFNFDILKYSTNASTNDFLSIMYTHGLYPLVTKPTRVTSSSFTCIDNVFTNVLDKSVTPGILFSDVSDHLPVFQFTTLDSSDKNRDKTRQYFEHQNFTNDVNYTDLIQDLCSVNWSCIDTCNDVNVSYDAFLETLSQICNKHTPKPTALKSRKRKKTIIRKPWITKGILNSINRKQRLFRTYISSPSCKNKLIYKRYRNKLNNIMRASKRTYLTNLIMRNKSNLRKTWKTVNEILGRHNTSKLPNAIEVLGNKIEDEKGIANEFNKYFSNIGSSIGKNVEASKTHFTDFLNSRLPESAYFMPTDESEIIEIAKGLKSSSSCGHDGLNSRLIKRIIHYLYC